MIVNVIERLNRGGAEAFVLDMSRWLDEHGQPCHVLARRGPLAQGAGDLVTVVPEARRYLGWHGALQRERKRRQVEIVNVHSVAPLPQASIWARMHRVPLVFTVHGYSRGGFDGLARAIHVTRPDAVVAVSQDTAERLAEFGVDAMVIRNCIPDLNSDGTTVTIEVAQRAQLLYVARFHPVKRHDLLIRAFARVRESMPHARLTLLGEGETLGATRRLVTELGLDGLVQFAGFADPAPHYREASIVVSSSEIEGLSIAQIEALMWGRPLVTRRTSGSRELIMDGVNGLVVDSANPDELAAGLVEALRDADLLARMGLESRALFESSFTADICLPQLVQFYGELSACRGVVR